VLFSPIAEVTHLRGRSVRHAPAASERLYRLSQLAFYAKHHPSWLPWLRACGDSWKLPAGDLAQPSPR
jgi:hypothetical protein